MLHDLNDDGQWWFGGRRYRIHCHHDREDPYVIATVIDEAEETRVAREAELWSEAERAMFNEMTRSK